MNRAEAIDNATAALKKLVEEVRSGEQPKEEEIHAVAAFDIVRASLRKVISSRKALRPASPVLKAAVDKLPSRRTGPPPFTDDQLRNFIDEALKEVVVQGQDYSSRSVFLNAYYRIKHTGRSVTSDASKKLQRYARQRYPKHLRTLKRQSDKASREYEKALEKWSVDKA